MKESKNLTQKDMIQTIEDIISRGDEQLSFETFNSSLSALDLYLEAQSKLQQLIDAAEISSIETNLLQMKLGQKIDEANRSMATVRQ